MIARTNIEIPWTWEHRIGELRLGEIDIIVSVDCETNHPVGSEDIAWSINEVMVETMERSAYNFLLPERKRHWLPFDDDLVAVIRKDLERDARFDAAVIEHAIEQAAEAV